MLTQELPPAGPGSTRRRWQAMTAEDTADGLVRAAHAELEQLALDPPVTPARVLPGQAQDQLSTLGDQTRASAPGAAGEQRPLAPDEIAMPAQQGLGADQEAGPGRARQPLAEAGEQEAISRPPAWPLDLALENAQLVPENQELKPEVGVWMTPIDEGLEEKTEDRVEEGEKHDRPSWQVDPPPVAGSPRYGVGSFLTAHAGYAAWTRSFYLPRNGFRPP